MLDIIRKAQHIPALPYEKIADTILGKSYALTLVFVGEQRAVKLNMTHRKKSYVPNVLSFPLNKETGEIYITPQVAKREAHAFGMSVRGYIGYLFIHGLLHLRGHRHGATMEQAEQKYVRLFRMN